MRKSTGIVSSNAVFSAIKFGAMSALAVFFVFLIPLSFYHFDFGTFINAGDTYVDKRSVPVNIPVRKNSDGYDGQFYFRLALNPDARQNTKNGITFDNASWRMQRIMYPVIVHGFSIFDMKNTPFFMVFVNFIGLFVLGLSARLISLRLNLPIWFNIAVVAWPGYLVTLEHDTTEIAAVAFLAAAIGALVAGRYAVYGVLAALATLTRETSILIFGGVFAITGLDWLVTCIRTRSFDRAKFGQALCCALALVPFVAWRHELAVRWGSTPGQAGATLLDWPFKGIAEKLLECLVGSHVYSVVPFTNTIDTVLVFATLVAFVGIVALVVVRLRYLDRFDLRTTGLVLGWALVATLHVGLAAANNGPWNDMTGYLRTCSEFWFMSVLLLAVSRFRPSRIQAICGLGFYAIVTLDNLF